MGAGFPSEELYIRYGATWIFDETARNGMLGNKSDIRQIFGNQARMDLFDRIENRINNVRYYSKKQIDRSGSIWKR